MMMTVDYPKPCLKSVSKACLPLSLGFGLAFSASTGTEIIKNGDFSSTALANWKLNIRNGANSKATMRVVDGQLEVNITKMRTPLDSAQGWDVQLNQTGLNLEKGKNYQVTWDARSVFPYQVAGYVAMNKAPWGIYSGYNSISLSQEMDTTGLYTFTIQNGIDVRKVMGGSGIYLVQVQTAGLGIATKLVRIN